MDERLLMLGSGFSFHNMKTFVEPRIDAQKIEFEQWLTEAGTDSHLAPSVCQSAFNCLTNTRLYFLAFLRKPLNWATCFFSSSIIFSILARPNWGGTISLRPI
jgi:hypothetical protein